MPRKRQNFSAEFKFQVALEAAKGQKTVNELASEFGVHPNRVSEWKQALLQDASDIACFACFTYCHSFSVFIDRRQSLHKGKEMFRLTGTKIFIPRFQCVRLKNT